MDSLDQKVLRAVKLFYEELSDANDAELESLLPVLIEAGYVEKKPWGDDPNKFLWSFTEVGRRRSEELEAKGGILRGDSRN